MLDPKVVFPFLSLVVASLMLWRAIRRREFTRPTLTLGLGPKPRTRRRRGVARSDARPELLLAQGVHHEATEPYFLMVPLLVQNKGRAAAQNLAIQLEYPAEFRVFDLAEHLDHFGFDLKDVGQDGLERGVATAGSRTIVHYSIRTLRPGETRLIAEPITIADVVETQQRLALHAFNGCPLEDLPERLLALFPFRVFLLSDTTEPLESDGLVFYVRAEDASEVSRSLNGILKALVEAHPALRLATLFGYSLLSLVRRPILTTVPRYQAGRDTGTLEIGDLNQKFNPCFVRVPSRKDWETLWSF